MKYYLLWASQGEYSDRSEWPVALYETKEAAEATVRYGEALYRQLYGGGYLPWEMRKQRRASPLGQELLELVGSQLSEYDDLTLSCCEIEMRKPPAQAIEAQRAGTTKIGPVADESAVRQDAPKGESRG